NNTLVSHIPGNTTQVGNDGPASGQSLTTTGPGPAISDDGRYVAFASAATNLTSTATSAGYNIFLFDRDASDASNNVARITQQSIPKASIPATAWNPLTPSISGDGRYLGYIGFATGDIAGLTNVNSRPGTKGMDALLYDQGSNPGTSAPSYA